MLVLQTDLEGLFGYKLGRLGTYHFEQDGGSRHRFGKYKFCYSDMQGRNYVDSHLRFIFSYFKMYVLSFLNQDGRPEIMTTDTGEWVTPAIVAFTDKEKVRWSLLQKSK